MNRFDARSLGAAVIVSPHLDDAVLACGQLLGSLRRPVVVTIFAGTPADTLRCTEWDASCGFGSAGEAMKARREEDLQALGLLGARPVWLNFCDAQYQTKALVCEIVLKLDRVIQDEQAQTAIIPLGLFHNDHLMAHRCALCVLEARSDLLWLAYADALYRALPGLLEERLSSLAAEGIEVVPADVESADLLEKKRQAMLCYASQLRGLATPGRLGHSDALLPEQYWTIAKSGTVKHDSREQA